MTDAESTAKIFQQLNAGPLGDKAALEIANRFISALTDAGLAIVPMEPTFDMVSEGGSVIWEHASEEKHQMIIRVWKAMIGAGK